MTITGAGTGTEVRAAAGPREVFAQQVRDYACQAGAQFAGRQVAILRAGCLTPEHELGLRQLRADGFRITVTAVDADTPASRHATGPPGEPGGPADNVLLGDLRTVPLPPRSFDIVHCALLIEHVRHVDLVLDRLVTALRPGGLLLLRTFDRDSAAGLLDRWLPGPARRAVWVRCQPGSPGPFPAVYERTVSARGIHGYALMRGLVIAHRSAVRAGPVSRDRLSGAFRLACALVGRLSRGRYPDSHDQLLFVIRKPEDRFARVV
jgi:SAM-dependent methyltransferase